MNKPEGTLLEKYVHVSLGHVRQIFSQGVGGEGVAAFVKFHKEYPDNTVVILNDLTGELKVLRNEKGEPMVYDNHKLN